MRSLSAAGSAPRRCATTKVSAWSSRPAATKSGYRLYDDHTVNRLAFIARAKHLGCSLEEITDLAGIWDGERCGPVQRHFHELVTAKIRDAERQIQDLTDLLDDLRAAAEHLASEPVDGPCDADCACLTIAFIPDAIALDTTRASDTARPSAVESATS